MEEFHINNRYNIYTILLLACVLGLSIVIIGLLILGSPVNPNNAASSAPNTSIVSSGSAEQNVPSGDIPDNALFLTFDSRTGGYSLQYIEGWVVTEKPAGGVDISDKDSSESIRIEPLPSGDLQAYVRQTDIPRLQANTTAFEVKGLTTIISNNSSIVKLSFASLSEPDPVTGKKRSIVSDRYYLRGTGKLAILTLTTPDGVDNVDAFNQILNSFGWK